MNTKIIGTIIILIGMAGLIGGGYLFYRAMFYVPDEPTEIVVEEQVEPEDSQEEEPEDSQTNTNTFNLPVETETGNTERIIELQERKSVVISGNEGQNQPEQSTTEDRLKRTASLFIERFGSYSNQSNFANVADLKIYMSDRMKAWAEDFIQKNNIDRDISVYYGITTKSISQQVESFNEGQGVAKITVNTLRRESGGDLTEDNSFYQNAVVTFVKENGFWKVDSANWQ